jgi:hypothetical protein
LIGLGLEGQRQKEKEHHKMKRLLLPFILAAAISAVFAVPAIASNPHFVKEPTCTSSTSPNGTITVTCVGGKIAGVGTEPTQVGIDVAGGCQTSGNGNEPPGHLQSLSAPITPKGGNIVLPRLSVSLKCPNGLNTVIGTTVQYFIVQDGVRTDIQPPIPIG